MAGAATTHRTFRRRVQLERELWLISVPMLVWVGIFCYYPIYGLIVAFYNYVPGRPILQNKWVGLLYFREFFTNPEFGMVMRNTLVISGLRMVFGFPAPIILALLLNELRNGRFKKGALKANTRITRAQRIHPSTPGGKYRPAAGKDRVAIGDVISGLMPFSRTMSGSISELSLVELIRDAGNHSDTEQASGETTRGLW